MMRAESDLRTNELITTLKMKAGIMLLSIVYKIFSGTIPDSAIAELVETELLNLITRVSCVNPIRSEHH